MKKLIIGTLLGISCLLGGSVNTPNYWKCYHQSFGGWGQFGRLPVGCDVEPFGASRYVKNEFSDLIFQDEESRSGETDRYMNTLASAVRDAARYYYAVREPDAEASEVDAWTDAVLAMAHQESYFSHYRKAYDKRIKMLRGDYGHGHGLMQIDDRWHFADIKSGKGWKLFDNLLYGMEIYYSAWQKAKNAWCVNGSDDYYNRSRSAYSIYNGGPSRSCRWKNPNDRWAGNDKNYKRKLDAKVWESYIDDPDKRSRYDAACYLEGNDHCEKRGEDGSDPRLANRILELPNGTSCLKPTDGSNDLECVEESRDLVCVASKYRWNPQGSTPLKIEQSALRKYSIHINSRSVCASAVPGVIPLGAALHADKSINIRTEPGGSWKGILRSDTTVQVLDYEIRDYTSLARYYKIKIGDKEGYIYAGNRYNYSGWASMGDLREISDIVIPVVGNSIKVMAKSGINLRRTIGGSRITVVPYGTRLEVAKTDIDSTGNKVNYKVDYHGHTGYIYGGHLLPHPTLSYWATAVDPGERSGKNSSYALKQQYWWTYLRSCASLSCSTAGYAIGKALEEYCSENHTCNWKEDHFKIIKKSGTEWSKVELERGRISGWIKSTLIDK